MLAFDIETTGLNPIRHEVTCACVFDGESGLERSFLFMRDTDPALREEFMALLDEAETLCAFNGARFDIPFLMRSWGIPGERVAGWMVKLIDVFEACKLARGVTFSLNALLQANGLEGMSLMFLFF